MTEPAYAELHCHSCFSLLDGASTPEELVRQAAALDLPALALTDHNAVYGAIPFVTAAQAAGIHPILGAELTLEHGTHLTLLVEDAAGWANLCYLITCAHRHAPKGEAALPLAELPGHTAGLIALSGCRKGAVAAALLTGRHDEALKLAQQYTDWFGRDHFCIELQRHLLPDELALNDALVALANRLRLQVVATNNVHYASRDRHRLQDVLVAIRHNTTLDESHHLRRPNSEYYLKSGRELAPLFRDWPGALAATNEIADRCRYTPTHGLQDLPRFPTPLEVKPAAYLRYLCHEALAERDLPPHAASLLDHELDVIARSGLANYFLIVWDIVRFARQQAILSQGRGSAANSLAAYLLGISPVDPLRHDLLFERFLSDERPAVPDIDIDFDAARREEVIQYVYRRYGSAHAAMACTFVTYRHRSALRDVGKALGLPVAVLERAALAFDRGDPIETISVPPLLLALSEQIAGFPRHLGIHNGGMVLTGAPLSQRLPTEPATMPDRTVVQWDKEMLETAGMVKVDILGLRMLSAVAEAVEIVAAATGQRPDLEALTCDDPAVYDQITEADTVGVFQVESRAQAQVLPRLRPRTFSDLVVSISLIRPGPVQGNMVHPYLRRRLGVEPVVYPHPLLEPALAETLGVILFQEQVLKVARDLAGFAPGQGELLRRALGSKHGEAAIAAFHDAFVNGANQKRVSADVAEAVFDSLRAFGGYSFPKSHAAAFAVLVYRSAWLKRHHPAAFYTALLNHQPMGFWSPAVIVNDAQRHGIPVLGVDLRRSQAACRVEGEAIRLGFSYVAGMGDAAISRLLAAREQGHFTDLADLQRRARLPRRMLENLILSGALDGWGERRALLWALGTLPVSDGLALDLSGEPVDLPPLSEPEALARAAQVTGVSTGPHVLALYRADLLRRRVLGSRDLAACPHGQPVEVAGLVVMHQSPPTARGFHFITLEDEDGLLNVIVRPDVYARYRRVIRGAALLLVTGTVQIEGDVVNVLAEGFAPAADSLSRADSG